MEIFEIFNFEDKKEYFEDKKKYFEDRKKYWPKNTPQFEGGGIYFLLQ